MVSLKRGVVYLVGGGPGDPGLITLRGIECLQQADVVVHDRLVNPSLLNYAPQAEWIDVGKRPDHHPVPQEEINALLVQQARAGKVVVRLKGGDPFVFGRGGEEALWLVDSQVPFEIIPGVTSAIAAPAYAGIPVTQRGVACSATVITGHRAECSDEAGSEWRRAAAAGDTLVFLMGVHNLPGIVRAVRSAGRLPDTPIALVEQATTHAQKTVTGTLANIVERARDIEPPAVIIIGEVVELREKLRWFDRIDSHPLLGKRILNTRPLSPYEASLFPYQDRTDNPLPGFWAPFVARDEFSRLLAGLGALSLELPATQVAPASDTLPLDCALEKLVQGSAVSAGSFPTNGRQPGYDWIIFPSANAVTFFCERLFALGHDGRLLGGVRLAAVGDATTRALRRCGLMADFVPQRATGRDLAAQIPDLAGKRVLVPRSAIASPELVDRLRRRGAAVEAVTAYQILPARPEAMSLAVLKEGRIDAATFFSPSALEGLSAMVQDEAPLAEVLAPVVVACVGPTTAQAAARLGVRVDITATQHNADGLCQALVEFFSTAQPKIRLATDDAGNAASS